MPGPEHDALTTLFHDEPQLVIELLRELCGKDLPTGLPVSVRSRPLNNRPSVENYPDTLVTLGAAHDPAYEVIAEVQRSRDEAKRKIWAQQVAKVWLETGADVTLLIFCPGATVALWAAQPIPTGMAGAVVRPVVVGPAQIPKITSEEEAGARPGWATLSVIAHGEDEDVARAFLGGLNHLNGNHATRYNEYAHLVSSEAVQIALEKIMASSTWIVSTPLGKEQFGKGKVEKGAQDVLRIADRRGLRLSEEQRNRVESCSDLAELDRWFDNAIDATTADDIFA